MTTYKSMLTLLETQLPHTCHIRKTGIHENGVTVSLQKEPGEIIRFFLTDDQLARACFAMNKKGIKCCDYLLLYTHKDSIKKSEVLCFIELKGKDLHKAGKQIRDTHQHVSEFSRQHLDKKQQPNVTQAVAIFLHARASSGNLWRERQECSVQNTSTLVMVFSGTLVNLFAAFTHRNQRILLMQKSITRNMYGRPRKNATL